MRKIGYDSDTERGPPNPPPHLLPSSPLFSPCSEIGFYNSSRGGCRETEAVSGIASFANGRVEFRVYCRGTSLIRKRPLVGPYRRPMPRVLGGS